MNKMEELFNSYKIRKYALYSSDEPMLPYIINELKYKVVIYGAGNAGHVAVKFVEDVFGVIPEYVIDVAPKVNKIGKIKVLSLKEFEILQGKNMDKYCALIATTCYSYNNDEKVEIVKQLATCGVLKIIDLIRDLESIIKLDWFNYFINHKKEFIDNYYIWEDQTSKDIYVQYIRALLEGDTYKGLESNEEDKYFGTGENHDLYKHLKDECWVNFGSYRGDTIYHFINKKFSFEKIYAIEGNSSMVGTLKRNLDFLEDDLKNKIEIIDHYFGMSEENNKVDDFFANARITLINMDIEGAELSVITSAKETIIKNRPVLAICAYHKAEDLLAIPKIIMEIVDNYKFFLRKYPSLPGKYYDGIFQTNELVLYAIPIERVEML